MERRNIIKTVTARQVFDSKGRPVVEAEIITETGIMGRSGASTGTSVGANESYVLRDGDKTLFNGLSVFKAVDHVKNKIAPVLQGMDVLDQRAIDQAMIDLDGTRNKANLGGNAIYAVSCAAARTASLVSGKEFWEYFADQKPEKIFAPAYNVVNGGTYGDKTLDFQEFLIIPKNVNTFYEGSRIGVEVFYKMSEVIERHTGKPAVMGNYSGYGAPSGDPFEIFDMLTEAVNELGYKDKVIFSMDCAASELYDKEKDAYRFKGEYISRDKLIAVLAKLADKYPIGFIEDALHEEDFEGYAKASKEIDAVLIGDDFICSSVDRAEKAISMNAIGGMILKPNQIGTLSEAVDTVRLMQSKGLLVVASGRAGGVYEDLNAELAIALGLPLMKTGAPRSGERVAFTNTGLRVEEKLTGRRTMADPLGIVGFERLKMKEAIQLSADDVKHLQANKKLIAKSPFSAGEYDKSQFSAKPFDLKKDQDK